MNRIVRKRRSKLYPWQQQQDNRKSLCKNNNQKRQVLLGMQNQVSLFLALCIQMNVFPHQWLFWNNKQCKKDQCKMWNRTPVIWFVSWDELGSSIFLYFSLDYCTWIWYESQQTLLLASASVDSVHSKSMHATIRFKTALKFWWKLESKYK